MRGQQRDILGRWRSGTEVIGNTLEAKEQVFAKAALCDFAGQFAVGRGDDPHVDAQRAVTTDALGTALLQHAQQFALQLQRDLADLVEKQGSAVGQFEAAARSRTAPVKAP